jgi:hypothetical protein
MFQYLFQFQIVVRFVNGFGSETIYKYKLFSIHYTHFTLDPVNNLFEVSVNLNPAGLFGFLLLDGHDFGFIELAEPEF